MPSPITRLYRRIREKFVKQGDGAADRTSLRWLEGAIGYVFKDRSLLLAALVHRSYLPEGSENSKQMYSNERMEFLGDSVLSLVVSDYLYRKYAKKTEGELTKMKSVIVSKPILSHYAKKTKLGSFILMSDNAQKARVGETESVLADALEAVFGAVYLDGGVDVASNCIRNLILPDLRDIIDSEDNINYKSLLQEYIQALHKVPPRYRVSHTTGPDHNKMFAVEVSVRGTILGRGEGKTKKIAEQEAAKTAYKKLMNTDGGDRE